MTTPRPRDNKALAVLLICAAVALASSQDALVKWISGAYPVHQAMLIRAIVAQPIVLGLVLREGAWRALLTPLWPRTVLRGAILCGAYLAFILSIAAMPIADAVAIYFTMPFFVAALAGPLLGETVRLHRWLAIAAGFLGVMVMIRPGRGVFEPAALLALLSAFGYGLGQMLGRDIARQVPPVVMAFHQNLVYLGVAALLALIFNLIDVGSIEHKSLAFLARPWAWPSAMDFGLMCGLGVLAAAAMVLFSTSYKLAESSFVAPFEYSSMFWAVSYGLLLWDDVPAPETLIGAPIVVAAGLFMLWMDRRFDRVRTARA